MNFDERKAAIFKYLYDQPSGLLRQYQPPKELSQDRLRDEINFMVEDINSEIPGSVDRSRLSDILEGVRVSVRRRHGSRNWPSIKLMLVCVNDALKSVDSKSHNTDDVEAKMIEMLADWYGKFGTEMPSMGSSSRTNVLIQQGVLTPVTARAGGFMVDEDVRQQAVDELNATFSREMM